MVSIGKVSKRDISKWKVYKIFNAVIMILLIVLMYGDMIGNTPTVDSIEYNAIKLFLAILFIIIIINPLHEYIHFIYIKKYGGTTITSINFLIGSVHYNGKTWGWTRTPFRNSFVAEISQNIFTIKQYIITLSQPFVVTSFIVFLYAIISKTDCLILLLFNTSLCINDLIECFYIHRYFNESSNRVVMFNDKETLSSNIDKNRDNIGFEILRLTE